MESYLIELGERDEANAASSQTADLAQDMRHSGGLGTHMPSFVGPSARNPLQVKGRLNSLSHLAISSFNSVPIPRRWHQTHA